MQLLVIRHAEAVPLGAEGVATDEERYLTPAGRAFCTPLADAVQRRVQRLPFILTSPLVRARQTAEALSAAWAGGAPAIEETPLLAPGGRKRKLLEALRAYDHEVMAIVGHNPDLSELVGWFLGDKNIGIDLEKGGVASLAFHDRPSKGSGLLQWLITPEWCIRG
jgi:phosphohistidine phosphatase